MHTKLITMYCYKHKILILYIIEDDLIIIIYGFTNAKIDIYCQLVCGKLSCSAVILLAMSVKLCGIVSSS